MNKLLRWFKKIVLSYKVFHGVDYAIEDKDYTCRLKGKRYKDGTIFIEDIEYLKPTTQSIKES